MKVELKMPKTVQFDIDDDTLGDIIADKLTEELKYITSSSNYTDPSKIDYDDYQAMAFALRRVIRWYSTPDEFVRRVGKGW